MEPTTNTDCAHPSLSAARSDAAHNLLLVCSDPDWSRAVHHAATAGTVQNCDARAALVRLARTVPGYSHLLLQDRCDDGLFDALFQLSSEAAGSETEMLLLGGSDLRQPPLNVIRTASSRSVQEALMVGPRQRGAPGVELNLAELREALDHGMISARYQPIVRITDRQPVALEVLARLDHPVQGTVLPDRFIPQIEDGGLAARLTEIVVARAFADIVSAG